MTNPADRSHPPLGPLGRLARLTYRRRGTVVLLWLATLLVTLGLSLACSGAFTADYSVAGSDSREAQQLLEQRFPAQSGATVTVVVRADAGVPSVRDDVGRLLADLRTVPHVTGTDDPFNTPGAVSADGRTLIAHARLDVVIPDDMPVTDSRRLIDIVRAHSDGQLTAALSGQPSIAAEQGSIGSEGIGLAAAAVILLLTFGSVVAAGLPILVAIAGLAISSALTGLLIRLVDAPNWSTSLAAMMGIGIDIDYVLLMVTRFREWRTAGLDSEAAAVATLDTAGRSVVVAGSTVIVSMLGLFAMGVSYMRGAALVTILGVLVILAASMTLFPALLGYFGRHVDRLRFTLGRRGSATSVTADGHVNPSRFWLRWGRFVERHKDHHCDRRRCRHAGAGRAVPERAVRVPGRGQQPHDDHCPAGVRPGRGGFRQGCERAAAARRTAAGR
jgi:RND superfamily putative drug exporter